MAKPVKPVKHEERVTDPETGEQLKIVTEKRIETWMDRLLKEKGVTIQEVEAPKDFVRVMIPKNNTQDK